MAAREPVRSTPARWTATSSLTPAIKRTAACVHIGERMRLFVFLMLSAPAVAADRAADGAIRRGLGWLRQQQSADGSFGSQPGQTALALLALRHSRVPASDRACVRAARSGRRIWERPGHAAGGARAGRVPHPVRRGAGSNRPLPFR